MKSSFLSQLLVAFTLKLNLEVPSRNFLVLWLLVSFRSIGSLRTLSYSDECKINIKCVLECVRYQVKGKYSGTLWSLKMYSSIYTLGSNYQYRNCWVNLTPLFWEGQQTNIHCKKDEYLWKRILKVEFKK